LIDPVATRAEIAAHLWRYLSPVGRENAQQLELEDVPLLRRSDVRAIRMRASLAVLQAVPVDRVIGSASDVLRRIPSAISYDRCELNGHVRGRVDWTASRVRSILEPSVFVCHIPRRNSDLPLNRSLAAILVGYQRSLENVMSGDPSVVKMGELLAAGVGGLAEALHAVRLLLQHTKIRGLVPARNIEASHVERLIGFGLAPEFTDKAVLRLLETSPSLRSVFNLIRGYLLEPASLSELFEMLVLTRITQAFLNAGLRPQPWSFMSSKKPFSEFLDEHGSQWVVYWQRSVRSILGSDAAPERRYREIMAKALVKSSALRPDAVIVSPSGNLTLFEMKYTDIDGTARESAGVIDMMAYLWDLGYEWQVAPPLGVVVAHGSAAVLGTAPVLICDENQTDIDEVVRRVIEFP
jgi:hypothetical protein